MHMIGFIEGEVRAKRTTYCVVSANGVGYKIFCTKDTLSHVRESEKAVLWTHLAVRESLLDLYGFPTEEDMRFFELLLTVSGIGPKSALGILDVASVETLQSAIAAGNTSYLTNVSGIGKKTAEKILLELKDKVGLSTESAGRSLSGDEEALEAMRALGYSQAEARDVLRKVPPKIEGSRERLKEALRILGRR